MNNTPETDELARSLTYEQLASTEKCYSEMRTLARSLESEREWETFCDLCYYYDLWRVRRKNERGFNDGYHLQDAEEARALVELLNGLERERNEARERVKELTHENENLYRRLESVHEVYRLSSVCLELKAENDKLKQKQP